MSQNLFTFVNNNPINRLDALGLKAKCGPRHGCVGWTLDFLGLPCEKDSRWPEDPSNGANCFPTLGEAEKFPCPIFQSGRVFTRSTYKCQPGQCSGNPDHPYGSDGGPLWDYCWRDFWGYWQCGKTCENGVCPKQDRRKKHDWADDPNWSTIYCVKCMPGWAIFYR
jgi:hypothetical protein